MQTIILKRIWSGVGVAAVSLMLASCGGGGGGGPQTQATATSSPTATPTSDVGNVGGNRTPTAGPTATAQTIATPTPGSQALISEEFDGSTFNNNFSVLGDDQDIQRTQFGLQPTFANEGGTSYARLRLETFNPDDFKRDQRNITLRGTQIVTKQRVSLGQGVQFEARMRGRDVVKGLVIAFFPFGDKGDYTQGNGTYSYDEIDHEVLTKQLPNMVWTNIYNDFRPAQPGFGGDAYAPPRSQGGYGKRGSFDGDSVFPLSDPKGWNIYKIIWRAGSVEWLINDKLIRRETSIVPNDSLGVRFNIWGARQPGLKDANGNGLSGWSDAYDPELQAASSDAAKQTYYLDIDYLRVTALGPTSGAVARRVPQSSFRGKMLKGVPGSDYHNR